MSLTPDHIQTISRLARLSLTNEESASALRHLNGFFDSIVASMQAVDTTGSGDAFAGALVAKLADGHSLVEAARFAARVGAFAATRRGAQASYPTLVDDLPTVTA